MCEHFQALSRGGQSKHRATNQGRAPGETPTAVVRAILEIAPPSFVPHTSSPTYTPGSTLDAVHCPICSSVLERPVELDCGKVVCAECMVRNIQESGELICPCCQLPLNSSHFHPPSSVTMGVLGSLLVKCESCVMLVKACNFTKHTDSKCTAHCEISGLNSPTKTTLQDVLSKSPDSTPSPSELRVAGNVIKQMMSSGEEVIKIPTGTRGQVNTSSGNTL